MCAKVMSNVMPEKISKMLKYNYDLRSMKNAFVTYADTESLLKKTSM